METVFTTTKERMQKTIRSLSNEYASIRAGRASAAVLDKIFVDYYGVSTPINQLAAISVAEARILNIQPWDATVLQNIEKAIQASDLGINPQNDGRIIRLIFPPLNEERRRQLVKDIYRLAEDGKIAIRQIRRDSIENLKKMEKASEITEDELRTGENKVQKIIDDFSKQIDDLAAEKEAEVMEI